jgi:hypothetical protein
MQNGLAFIAGDLMHLFVDAASASSRFGVNVGSLKGAIYVITIGGRNRRCGLKKYRAADRPKPLGRIVRRKREL